MKKSSTVSPLMQQLSTYISGTLKRKVPEEVAERCKLHLVDVVARVPSTELKVVDNRDMVDISLQHLLAVMLLDGTMTFAAAHDYRRAKDPKVLRMRERIEAIPDAGIFNAVRGWRCILEVTLKNGQKVTHETMAAKGSPDNPLNRAEVAEKALDLMGTVLGKRQSNTLIGSLFVVQKLDNVGVLRRLYAA